LQARGNASACWFLLYGTLGYPSCTMPSLHCVVVQMTDCFSFSITWTVAVAGLDSLTSTGQSIVAWKVPRHTMGLPVADWAGQLGLIIKFSK
jgi:hypothetical protein